MLGFGSILILDLVVNVFIHSLRGVILLYLAALRLKSIIYVIILPGKSF